MPYNITKKSALSFNGIEHFDSKGSPPEITIAMFILFLMILFAKSHSQHHPQLPRAHPGRPNTGIWLQALRLWHRCCFTLLCHLVHDVLCHASWSNSIFPASVINVIPDPVSIYCFMQSIDLLAGLFVGRLLSNLASRRSFGYLVCSIILMCPKTILLG